MNRTQPDISAQVFFASVSSVGYPCASSAPAKVQPWTKFYKGPQKAGKGGEVLIACPKKCDFGMPSVH